MIDPIHMAEILLWFQLLQIAMGSTRLGNMDLYIWKNVLGM